MGPHTLMQLFQGYKLASLRSLLHSHQEFSPHCWTAFRAPEEIENMILVKIISRNPRDQQSQHLLGQVKIESKGLKVKFKQKTHWKTDWQFLKEGVLLFISSCKSSTQSLECTSWLSNKIFFRQYFAVLTLKASPGVLFQYQQHQIIPQGSAASLAVVQTRAF